MGDEIVDILIIGGGLIGAALMLALEKTALRVMMVEAKPFRAHIQPDFDARNLALSPATVRILSMLNVWPGLESQACPIETIQVSEQFAFGQVHLRGEKLAPLGHVVLLQDVHHALCNRLDLSQVVAPAELVSLDSTKGIAQIRQASIVRQITAKLIVAADGSHSAVRALCGLSTQVRDYHQHAIVANIGLARAHQRIAYERFTAKGSLALLPMNGLRASMVWALGSVEAKQMMLMEPALFLSALQRTLGYRLGRLVRVGERESFPLQQIVMPESIIAPHVVFIGNAAHTLHPVAGQGFNLGLRDVAMLSQCIIKKGMSPSMLLEYQQLRRSDQQSTIHLTDSLVQIFASQLPFMACARRMGLLALDQVPVLKAMLMRYGSGFSGIIPDLVCGIPLNEEET